MRAGRKQALQFVLKAADKQQNSESVIDQLESSKVYVNKVLRVEDAVQIIVVRVHWIVQCVRS